LTDHILYEQDGPLAFLTFNRPQARNAMTWEMYQTVVDRCDAVEADPSIQVLILRGAGGKAFVSGTDIAQFRNFESPNAGIDYEQRLDTVIDRLESVTKSTIAQIDGVTTGGGCALAAACDLRFCTPTSRFGVPIARTLGNCMSAANHERFLDLVGPANLKEILYTGRLLDATDALRVGLVNRVVERAALDETVRQTAQTISSNAPLTVKATKEIIRRIHAHRRLPAEAVHDLIVMCYTSADFREGVESFLAKRPPKWTGS
jgi:enoyl-CoA hydratase/carnithine racemase